MFITCSILPRIPHDPPRRSTRLTLAQLLAIADSYDAGRGLVAGAPRHAVRRRARRRRSTRRPATTPVYGINTGFGALAETRIPREALGALQLNLLRSHAAGVGDAAAGARRARVDGAARQRPREGLLRHPAQHAGPADRAAQPRACTRASPAAARSAPAATSRRSPTCRSC